MPAPPAPIWNVPGLIRVELHYLFAAQHCMNVHYCNSNLHETSDTHMHLVANTFKNWWSGTLRTYISNQVSLYEVTARELVPDGLAVLETEDLPVTGNRGSPALPNNVSLAVHWGTGHVGRSAHGRTYILGLTQDEVTGNVVNSSELASIKSAYDALRTALDNITLNVEFSIVSFVHANAWRTAPLVTPITGVSIENTVDSMRRRLPGRGQ
jgi:hypothetical protein